MFLIEEITSRLPTDSERGKPVLRRYPWVGVGGGIECKVGESASDSRWTVRPEQREGRERTQAEMQKDGQVGW